MCLINLYHSIGHWRRHYPVCTIISRMDKLRTRQVLTRRYEKREENLDPEELSMMTVAEHKKYFNVQASETEDTSRILEEIRKVRIWCFGLLSISCSYSGNKVSPMRQCCSDGSV